MSIELCVFRFGCFLGCGYLFNVVLHEGSVMELFIGCVFRNMEIERSNR